MNFFNYYLDEIKKYGGECNYVFAKAKEKKPLLDRIKKYSKRGKILEAGSGSSSNSIFLASQGYLVTSLDKNKKMLDLAKKIAKQFDSKLNFIKEDIKKFNGKEFSVVFSHGVLEHFNDKEIIEIINKELNIGEYVIFSVPSDFFNKTQAINGDERFMSKNDWKRLISITPGKIIEEFSYFYDPDTPKLRMLKILSKITLGILPIKKPYIGFVLEKNVRNT